MSQLMQHHQVLVTGGAGFIGSRLAEALDQQKASVTLCDDLDHFKTRSELNFTPDARKIDRNELFQALEKEPKKFDVIYHMGACSDTTETRWEVLQERNLEFSQRLWSFTSEHKIPLIYASSAATYGDGQLGFSDDESLLDSFEPLNLYGKSKHLFDLWALDQEKKGNHPPRWSGFKFFNVYGFGEHYKGAMASVVWKAFQEIQAKGKLTLFKSHHKTIQDGEQKRDFIAVEDVIRVLIFAAKKPIQRGIYNLGTGHAQSFLDLGRAVFKSLEKELNIEFIPTPVEIRDKYQYFTQAKMDKLLNQGLPYDFMSLNEGVNCYWKRVQKRLKNTNPSDHEESHL